MLSSTEARTIETDHSRIRDELVRQAYHQQPGSLFVALFVALVVAFLLRDVGAGIWLWLLAMCLICGARLLVQGRFVREARDVEPLPPGWARDFALGQLTSGLVWALLPLLWLNALPVETRYVVLVVLSGLGAGASTMLAAALWSGRIFISLAFLPAAAMMALGPQQSNLLGGLAILFYGVMLFAHRNNHRQLVRTLALRAERAELVDRLTQRTLQVEELNSSLEEKIEARTHELARVAETDMLTGLLNRRGMSRRLEARLNGAKPVAVMLFDLVRFRQINNRLGYAAGDEVLREIARRVAVQLPAGADFARWGGDEFVVVCEDAGHGARHAWQLIRKALQADLPAHGEAHRISAHAGIAIESLHGQSAVALLNAADLALTELKRQGRGNLMFYRDSLAPAQRRRLDLAFEIQSADVRGELYLLYQPIVSARDGHVESLEVLLRWQHPRFGLVPPDEFIPIVEESAAINRLGEWVLAQACRAAMQWVCDARRAPRVAVNVSVLQLRDPDFVQHVADILLETGISPERLDIEVTESVFDSNNAERISLTLSRLCSMGLRTYIDDFGTGYSSLSRLHALPIDGIKIDRSFIASLDTGSTAIIEAAILIARRFDLQTVAEGVETLSQARALHRLGVDTFQGYFIQKPQAAARMQVVAPDWLERETLTSA